MKRQPDLIPRVFDDGEFVSGYVRRHAKLSAAMGKLYADMLSEAGLGSGRILDLGTGPGGVAIHLARALPQAQVVGADLAETALETARSAARQAGLSGRVCFEQADAQALPYDKDCFDAVISLNTLHVVDDPVAMLNEIERVLKPEGVFAVRLVRRWWLGWLVAILRTGYTAAETRAIVAQSRLRPAQYRQGLWWIALGTPGHRI